MSSIVRLDRATLRLTARAELVRAFAHRVATRKLPASYPQATRKLPASYPQATRKLPAESNAPFFFGMFKTSSLLRATRGAAELLAGRGATRTRCAPGRQCVARATRPPARRERLHAELKVRCLHPSPAVNHADRASPGSCRLLWLSAPAAHRAKLDSSSAAIARWQRRKKEPRADGQALPGLRAAATEDPAEPSLGCEVRIKAE